MLVIDGLPPLKNEYEKYIQSIDATSSILLKEQIQRIEQGMGRGVRANSDSCCIVLMDDSLADVLIRNKGICYFSSATMKQYMLSKELWDLLKEQNVNPSINDIFELAEYSLNREIDWITKSKEYLSCVNYESSPNLDNVSIALRKAFEYANSKHWKKAANEIDKAYNSDISNETKGYLLQIKATYLNFIDQVQAQQTLLAAYRLNSGVLYPIDGIQYSKSINNMEQARAICAYAKRKLDNPNEYILYVEAVSSKLIFSPDAEGFEAAIEEFGKLLGFVSTRPDKETNGAGPDNLWAIGSGWYFVIECKSGSNAETISKDYCNQLGGSVRWFKSVYGADYFHNPVIVHKSVKIDRCATPIEDMRIMSKECIDKLKMQFTNFAIAMAQNENWLDEGRVHGLLSQYHLRGQEILQYYTVEYKR